MGSCCSSKVRSEDVSSVDSTTVGSHTPTDNDRDAPLPPNIAEPNDDIDDDVSDDDDDDDEDDDEDSSDDSSEDVESSDDDEVEKSESVTPQKKSRRSTAPSTAPPLPPPPPPPPSKTAAPAKPYNSGAAAQRHSAGHMQQHQAPSEQPDSPDLNSSRFFEAESPLYTPSTFHTPSEVPRGFIDYSDNISALEPLESRAPKPAKASNSPIPRTPPRQPLPSSSSSSRSSSSSSSDSSSSSSSSDRRRKKNKKGANKGKKGKGKAGRRKGKRGGSTTSSSSSEDARRHHKAAQKQRESNRPAPLNYGDFYDDEYGAYDVRSFDGSMTNDLNSALFHTPRSMPTAAPSSRHPHAKAAQSQARSGMTATNTRNNITTPISADPSVLPSRRPSELSRFPFDDNVSFHTCVSDDSESAANNNDWDPTGPYPSKQKKGSTAPAANRRQPEPTPRPYPPPTAAPKPLNIHAPPKPPLPTGRPGPRLGLVTGGPVYAHQSVNPPTLSFSSAVPRRALRAESESIAPSTAFYSCRSDWERDSCAGFNIPGSPLSGATSTVNGALPSEMFHSIPSTPGTEYYDAREPDSPESRYSSSLASSVWLENDVQRPPAMVSSMPPGQYRTQGRQQPAALQQRAAPPPAHVRAAAARHGGPAHQDPSISPTFRGTQAPELYLISPNEALEEEDVTPRKGPRLPHPAPVSRNRSREQSGRARSLQTVSSSSTSSAKPRRGGDVTPEIIHMEEVRPIRR